jgi:CopG family transcriptional regulator, nickel-responsive regulator
MLVISRDVWKMTIVSLSFPDQMIKEMDQIQKSGGFAGRSELVRAAIRLLLEDAKEKDNISGHMNAIIVVTHDESNEAPITRLKHEFEDIVRTHIHNKISQNNCVELFLLEGEGKKIASMTREFQKEDKLKSVKLVAIE